MKFKEFDQSTVCSECGGPAFSDLMLAEKKDACYSKVRSRYKVWPSAYASGALVQCRKKGAANWGNKSKNESLAEFAPVGSGGGMPPRGPKTPGHDRWGGDDSGEDPYSRPEPEYYSRSIDFFGKFEADHFDKEDFNEKTGVFKGYWDYDGELKQIAYFKFDDPQQAARDFNDSPGMGWYYEPMDENLNEFAPGSGDDDDYDSEDVLFRLAQTWYTAPDEATEQRAEQTLAKMGWEIGGLESEEGGAFVMEIGDDEGHSYIAWSAEDLEQGVAEGDVVSLDKHRPTEMSAEFVNWLRTNHPQLTMRDLKNPEIRNQLYREFRQQDISEDHGQPTFEISSHDNFDTAFEVEMIIDNNNAGFFSYQYFPKTNDVENDVDIHSDQLRGQGLGKLLLLKAIETAQKHGLPFKADRNGVTPAQGNVYRSLMRDGFIKLNPDRTITLTGRSVDEQQLAEKCWDTHRQAGMKKKGNRMVPNCVPKESKNVMENNRQIYNQVYQILVKQAPDFMKHADSADVKRAIIKAMSFGDQISPQDLASYAYGMIKTNSIDEDFNPEYDDEAGMADNNLQTLARAVQGIDDLIDSGDNLPEWCQEKIANAKSMLVAVWDYMRSEEDREEDPEDVAMYEAIDTMAQALARKYNISVDQAWESFEALPDHVLYETAQYRLQHLTEDWQKVNKQDKTDGMSRRAVKAYRRENPGSKLKTAVTTKPSKLKKGGKAAKRRKSFCARMRGMKKSRASAKTKRNPNSPINKALRRWNC